MLFIGGGNYWSDYSVPWLKKIIEKENLPFELINIGKDL